MDSGGSKTLSFRGSASTRIDEKGRIKIPTIFRAILHARSGPDVYVTSVTGDSVLIYPIQAWHELEERLDKAPSQDPSVLKFKDRISYYGQVGELDPQGRVVIAPHLRQRAAIEGEVRVFGKGKFLEVWNEQRFAEKLVREPWTDDDGRLLSEHGV
jgi:MraZ protein